MQFSYCPRINDGFPFTNAIHLKHFLPTLHSDTTQFLPTLHNYCQQHYTILANTTQLKPLINITLIETANAVLILPTFRPVPYLSKIQTLPEFNVLVSGLGLKCCRRNI